jgi:hypothetical protein
MPTPEGLKTTVIHGQYAEPNLAGTPLQGVVTFSVTPSILTFPDQNIIIAGTETATLDANGEFIIELIATDTVNENPTGWLYTVTEKLIGVVQRTYTIALPYNNGVTVELSDITPTTAAPTYIPVIGPTGPPGSITNVNGHTTTVVTLTAADVSAIATSARGAVNGVASLDGSTKVPVVQLPDLSGTYVTVSRIGAANGVAGLSASSLVPSTQLDISTTTPLSVATTGAVGTATKLVREDHVHPGVDLSSAQTIAGLKTFSAGTRSVQLGVGVAPGTYRAHVVSTVDEIVIQADQVTITGANPVIGVTTFDATMNAFSAKVSGDSINRVSIKSSGNIEFGTGAITRDVTFYRSAAGILNSTGQFASDSAAPTLAAHLTRKDYVDAINTSAAHIAGTETITGAKTFTGGVTVTTLSMLVEGSATTSTIYRGRVTADTQSRILITADGKITWGTGAAVGDTNLYRSNTSELTTDDALIVSLNLSTLGDLSIKGRGMGRGLLGQITRTASVTIPNATPGVLMTLPSVTFQDGRAYRVTVWGHQTNATASTYCVYSLVKGTTTGGTVYVTGIRVPGLPVTGADAAVSLVFHLSNTTGAPVTTQMVLTGSSASGTGTWSADAAGLMSYVTVEDIGLAADWPGSPVT